MDKLLFMEFTTLEKFYDHFDTEQKCIDFLFMIKDVAMPGCPRCKHDRFYIIDNGKRRKCGNNKCYLKYSPTSLTLINATNLKIREWLICIYMYARSKGRFSSTKLVPGYHFATCYIIDQKLELMFKNIIKIGVSTEWIFNESLKNIYYLKDQNQVLKRNFLKRVIIDPNEIMDLSDESTYRRCVLLSKIFLNHALQERWIFSMFTTAEEVVAETFLSIAEAEPKIITGDFFVTIMKKTQTRLYGDYVKQNPKLANFYRLYRKRFHEEGREKLDRWYLVQLLNKAGNKKEGWQQYKSYNQIKNELEVKKEQLIEKRKKWGRADNSEFIKEKAVRIVVKNIKEDVWN